MEKNIDTPMRTFLFSLLTVVRGIVIIFSFLALGKVISAQLPFSFPAAILALLLLFISLALKIIKIEWISLSSQLFIRYMPLLFIPIGVGLIDSLELIAANFLNILLSALLTTFFSLTLVGHLYQYLSKK